MSLRYAVEDSKNGCAYSLYNIITPKVGLSYIENMNFSKIVQQDYTLSSGLGGLHGRRVKFQCRYGKRIEVEQCI